jgi:hypothetical protein
MVTDTTSPASPAKGLADPRPGFRWETHQHKERQVSHIQRVLLWHLNQTNCDVRVAPQLACAWERLQNRLDRMLGNPEPKAQDPDKLKPAKKRAAAMPSSMDPSAKE